MDSFMLVDQRSPKQQMKKSWEVMHEKGIALIQVIQAMEPLTTCKQMKSFMEGVLCSYIYPYLGWDPQTIP